MGSVIYVGRGSFRMEAVALEPELEQSQGVVQPIADTAHIVTAPLHAPRAGADREEGRGAPDVRALFGSQVDVPVLAAPTGAVGLSAPVITLSRGMLATLGALVLLCGVVVGTACRHLFARPAPLAFVVPAATAPALPEVAPLPPPEVETAPPSPPPMVAVPAPLTIRAHAKAVARRTAVASPRAPTPTQASTQQSTKPWVDPWAD
jgi:hypothetical protein